MAGAAGVMRLWGKAALWAGAAVDAAFGTGALFAAPRLGRVLGLPLPAELLYVKLAGLLLLGLAGMYACAALWPEKYFGNVVVAAMLRLAGALFFLVMARGGEAPPLFLGFALMDGLLGLSHAAFALQLAARSRSEP